MDAGYHQQLISRILKERPSKRRITDLKMQLCRMYKGSHLPTDIEVLLHAKPKDHRMLCRYLLTKPVRSVSGVSVVAVMTKPHRCPHGRCITCPGGPRSVFGTVPQSYTGEEPATRRARRNHYDPYMQVFSRLMQYLSSGHMPCKIELIVMGGTFPALSRTYQERFIAYCYKALNDFSRMFVGADSIRLDRFREFFELPGNLDDALREKRVQQRIRTLKGTAHLEKEKLRNESAWARCVGLTIETRSDYGTLVEGNKLLRLGATRIELGVQSVYDSSLKKMGRGHTTKDTIDSMRTLRDLGFKINAHYMPGLFVAPKQDLAGMRMLFESSDYRPDMLKLYPCMVMPGTKLYQMWKKGEYKPLTTQQAAELIVTFKQYVPPYCRIMRVQRDIPTKMIAAGVERTNLRQYIQTIMRDRGLTCRCIRCSEIGSSTPKGPIRYQTLEYEAAKGTEFFISAEQSDRLIGFLRMRFPSQKLRPEITCDSVLVRELHVYGDSAELGIRGKVQHRGIGRTLLAMAERTATSHAKRKILVISGIGVREYYRRLGYRREGPYMVKWI
jgi:elongator complex protein 3